MKKSLHVFFFFNLMAVYIELVLVCCLICWMLFDVRCGAF